MNLTEIKPGNKVEWYDLGCAIKRGTVFAVAGFLKARMDDGYEVDVRSWPESVHPVGTLDKSLHAKVLKALKIK